MNPVRRILWVEADTMHAKAECDGLTTPRTDVDRVFEANDGLASVGCELASVVSKTLELRANLLGAIGVVHSSHGYGSATRRYSN